MDELELLWLAEQAQSHKRIVEVGCFLGRSTRALADNTEGIVYAFDDWKGPREDFHEYIYDQEGNYVDKVHIDVDDPQSKSFLDRTKLFAKFTNNVKDLIESGKVIVIRGDHSATHVLPPEWIRGPHKPEDRPDMVFIDGSHEYEDVKRDINIWRQRLAPGGLLCGHDAARNEVFNAVMQAFGKVPLVPFTDIWSVNV